MSKAELHQSPLSRGGEPASDPGCGPRRKRSDAVKNRERILCVAEEVFAAEGLSVPIDTVAERAGVGVGTVYRHFPTKEALFEAIVTSKIDHLVREAEGHANDADPEGAFFSFLGLLGREAASKHDLMDAIDASGIDIKMRCAAQVEQMKFHLDCLLQRAITAGAVRSDVSADEVVGLIMGTVRTVQQLAIPTAARDRMLDVIRDGLRAQGR